MIDTVPRQFADVDQAVRATEIDERAEIAQTCPFPSPLSLPSTRRVTWPFAADAIPSVLHVH